MCGIAGSYGLSSFDVDRALDRIQHRGPDGRGLVGAGDATHGHVRLALVDLTEGSAQPFRRNGAVLSFVGEIWNHRELRIELEQLGHTFTTTGDTEVLAAALEQWGEHALERLDGMFAFAWSSASGEHVLIRDRWGKVPLYVQRRGAGFAWASERKAFIGSALALDPASLLDLKTGSVKRWWSPSIEAAKEEVDLPGRVLEHLRRGVRRRLLADAPVCCLVSGGLDSALVLALACEISKPVAYTAVFEPASPDLVAARRLCAEFEVELREVAVPTPDAAAAAMALAAIEIPSKAQVEIAVLCLPLAGAIASDGFKACLSGEAADELFGGYGNMAIQASREDDDGWRALRRAQVAKMARGNFVRCNLAFMAHGVECRLPFMERQLAELVLGLGKRECPPGKSLLKVAAASILPTWLVRRQKQTFQGASGVSAALARAIANPTRYYNAEYRRLYG